MRKRSLAIKKIYKLRQTEGDNQYSCIKKVLLSRKNIFKEIKLKREQLNLIKKVSRKVGSNLDN